MKLMNNMICLFICSLFIFGCSSENKNDDKPTMGEINISVDESFAPVIDTQLSTFQNIYVDAKVNVRYMPEQRAIEDWLNDSSRLVIISRKLNKEESDYFKKLEIEPHGTKIFYDAIAVIVNNQNRDTLMSFDKLKDILSGKITKWKQLDPASPLSDIQIIFDNPNSSTVRYIKEQLSDSLPKNTFAVKTNPEVINYVSKNKNAVGLIGVSWISDHDDSTTNKFLNTIKVVGLKSNIPNVDPNEYYQPYQAYIAQKYYPMIREVYVISREARAGLGSGFAAFIAGEKGQRIFLKAGLVPATMPIRLIETDQEQL